MGAAAGRGGRQRALGAGGGPGGGPGRPGRSPAGAWARGGPGRAGRGQGGRLGRWRAGRGRGAASGGRLGRWRVGRGPGAGRAPRWARCHCDAGLHRGGGRPPRCPLVASVAHDATGALGYSFHVRNGLRVGKGCKSGAFLDREPFFDMKAGRARSIGGANRGNSLRLARSGEAGRAPAIRGLECGFEMGDAVTRQGDYSDITRVLGRTA